MVIMGRQRLKIGTNFITDIPSGRGSIGPNNAEINVTVLHQVARRKGCPNYPPEFKQQLVAASCEPGISISKLALENGINANLLFKWRQQWREGKLLLPSSESPQLLPVTLDAAAEQPESLAEDPETLSISCEVTFRHGTLRFNGNVSEKLLTLLIQELKR
ncbi:IS66-like element accessory protein TnpA [Escherichia coli]|uniref:IS66-like element accessory protein TnpA n=4 Tax=Escherichia coli TaxID=562 RepID=UPI00040ED27B|nr:transposase [Escherichia coli]EFB2772722.1 transposase [Escherichia coli]EFC0641465.1 transposase [Escherichia coli]EFC9797011.1 transposase [Escherichia coli]EFH4451589.1 transposase [Escherichia coli]EFM9866624.1 transposase [Escherichia coli]